MIKILFIFSQTAISFTFLSQAGTYSELIR